jgi:hypothetical protein
MLEQQIERAFQMGRAAGYSSQSSVSAVTSPSFISGT